ncbi:MAG: hypothetical protein WC835_00840 [Candidatus Paceibacterota bacterium]|jgi:hypothetical protein
MHALLVKIALIITGAIALFFPVGNNVANKKIETNTPQTPSQVVEVKNQDKEAATTTQKIITPVKATTSVVKITVEQPKKLAVETIPMPATKSPGLKTLIPLEVLNEQVRAATVNIFCTTKTGGDFKPISGSGVIISRSGVILTNAHVAQYLLLKDYYTKGFMNCIARTGSPAMPSYRIELLYMPESWLAQNAKMIKQESPEGTGEDDYALLLITGGVANTFIPSSFPFVDIDTDQKHVTGDVPVLLSGYPANFLGGIETERDLWITTSPAYLTKLYYFNEKGNVDAFSLGANILAQKGVSGGAAVNQWSGLIQGLLTTITGGNTTGARDLSAISTAHIARSFKNNTGISLEEFVGGDTEASLKDFTQKNLPGLIKTLIDALDSEKAN